MRGWDFGLGFGWGFRAWNDGEKERKRWWGKGGWVGMGMGMGKRKEFGWVFASCVPVLFCCFQGFFQGREVWIECQNNQSPFPFSFSPSPSPFPSHPSHPSHPLPSPPYGGARDIWSQERVSARAISSQPPPPPLPLPSQPPPSTQPHNPPPISSQASFQVAGPGSGAWNMTVAGDARRLKMTSVRFLVKKNHLAGCLSGSRCVFGWKTARWEILSFWGLFGRFVSGLWALGFGFGGAD